MCVQNTKKREVNLLSGSHLHWPVTTTILPFTTGILRSDSLTSAAGLSYTAN